MEASAQGPVDASGVRPTWPTIAVVNDASSGLDDQTAQPMVHAVAAQVLEHFGPIWHIGAHFVFVGKGQKPPAGAWTVALLGSSDEAGALGYHDLTPDGLPLGKVFVKTDLQYGQKVSVTLSHEVLEMLGDPWINLAAQAPDGRFFAWETCDAVEADDLGYGIAGVEVSAFVTPAWFGNGGGQVSFPAGRVSKPLELAVGGYISVFDPSSGQGWQQVDAQRVGAQLAAALAPGDEALGGLIASASGHPRATSAQLAHSVPRVGSRRERRFRGRGLWVPSTYEQE